MTLIKWKPVNSINSDIDLMLDRIFNDGWNNYQQKKPSVDIIENEKEFILITDLPGFDKKNVNIEIEENRALSITANSKINEESNDEFYRIRERNDGSYHRKFVLPENVVINKIDAQFNNGSLVIKLPKAKEVKSENRKIKIS